MIDELIERVEKGEGRDRRLDYEIATGIVGVTMWDPDKGNPYTTSLDAVLALIEENRSTIMDNSPADFLAGCIEEMMVRGWRPHEPSGPQICRAVLAAFLRAHKEQHDGR